MTPPRRALVIVACVGAVGLIGCWTAAAWRDRSALRRARHALAAGQYAVAREDLSHLASRRPTDGEVQYALGVCENGLGRFVAALDAWSKVPARSPLAERAAIERARLALAHGRLAIAEESLDRMLRDEGGAGEDAQRLAKQVDLFSGRAYRINRRIEQCWRNRAAPAAELRTHWLFDTQPLPLGAMAESLARFAREAPDDDRVWLGQADLAVRTGRYDEADGWLRRCEARRPDDPDVQRVRLAWALDSRRVSAAARALARLRAGGFAPAEVEALAARFAALRGNAADEHSALRHWVALEPGAGEAWKRLFELAAGKGRAGQDEAREARRRKTAIDAASDRYRTLMGKVAADGVDNHADLARAAEALGRSFEARGWWLMRLRQSPDDGEARDAVARLKRPVTPERQPADKTLAEIVPHAGEPLTTRVVDAIEHVPKFRDDAESAGLRFIYDSDQTPLRRLPETMGGGLALIDFDGDGWLDVYAVQGGRFRPARQPIGSTGDRLFRNNRDGTFRDVTEASGIASLRGGFSHGVAVGDYDNDGHPDLFVTRWRAYALYHNKGNGTFEDATQAAGLGGDRGWPTSAAFADLDGDGDLDLFVCQYLRWDPERSPPCVDPERPGRHVYCVPRAFDAEPDRVYRNDGGRFVDVTVEAGIVDRDGRGLGVVIVDLDADGRPDIFVANDMTANALHHNRGGFRFEETAESWGVASSGSGGYQAGMGIACGDVDRDGRPDLVVTNFYGESATFYQNLGGGLFADRTSAAGLAAPTRFKLGFGAFFLDADNDGWLDLAVANGHVNDYRPAIPYAMPAQLFLGRSGGRFADVSERAGACWNEPRVARGLAVGDLNNDGLSDVLLLSQNSPLAYFRNLGPAGAGLTLLLEGTASNRDAVGAVVRVHDGQRTQTAWRLGGGSFLSASDGRLQFGLGARADSGPLSAEVQWPGGRIERFRGLNSAGAYRLIEGTSAPRALEGWPARR